jgi:hypothetical protein
MLFVFALIDILHNIVLIDDLEIELVDCEHIKQLFLCLNGTFKAE